MWEWKLVNMDCVRMAEFELLKWFTLEKKSYQLSDNLKVKSNISQILWSITSFNQAGCLSVSSQFKSFGI